MQDYTIGQMTVFLREARAAERRAWRMSVAANRIGMHADKDDYREAMDDSD